MNSTENLQTAAPASAASQPRSRRRRLLLSVALVIWFTLLLLPCVLFTLAINQEIVISTGDLPGQQLRVWLVMEPMQRGLGYSFASVAQRSENSACLTTNNGFLLWQGRGEPASYCECYERASAAEPWTLASVDMAACSPAR